MIKKLSELDLTEILVVDDDPIVIDVVRSSLEREGFRVWGAQTAEQALDLIAERNLSLLVLDVILPNVDGFSLCRHLRNELALEIPILFLSSQDKDHHQLSGFESGGDDYLPKPFNPDLLSARVKALLRRWRRRTGAPETGLKFGPLSLHPGARSATLDGAELHLTQLEFDLIVELASHPREALSREHLQKAVWGDDYIGDARVVDVHIRNIRKKLKSAEQPFEPITAVRGVGYRFDP